MGGAVRTDLGDGLGKVIGANPSCPLDPLPSVMQLWEPPTIMCLSLDPIFALIFCPFQSNFSHFPYHPFPFMFIFLMFFLLMPYSHS